MKKEATDNNYISSELLAAYLDGRATAAENERVLKALAEDSRLREVVKIAQAVDEPESFEADEIDLLPMTALAASCGDENYCCLECETYILNRHQIAFDEKELLADAVRNKWQKPDGTPLHHIGRHLERYGLSVTRRYQCSLSDIVAALDAGCDVIAAVDGGELLGHPSDELAEDLFIGQIPDHTVVILACDTAQHTITLHDPNSSRPSDSYPTEQFMNAWADSKYYLVTATNDNSMNQYTPHPIDLTDVMLDDDLNDLREAIAENAHEIWAENRKAEGWTYGPQRNDSLKQTPDMVSYGQLPESEKRYDREMAMQTIKLLKKLGYDLIKREDTELYQVLKRRMQESKQEYRCPQCGNTVYRHQHFCDQCGTRLDNITWDKDQEDQE